MEPIVLLALALVAFSYAGYFVVLSVWDAVLEAAGILRFLGGGPDRRVEGRAPPVPRVSIVFSAHDEASCIRQKIENCLALDYPPERLEILVACDGCTDGTADLARAAGGDRVRVFDVAPRAGKSAALSRLVPQASGDVVVLTDANVMLDPAALRALVRRFEDPAVGAVVGRLRLFDPQRKDARESLYWRYETALKYYEGKRGCVLGANGGLYAIRRLLFQPLRPDTLVDDFVIPVRIALRGWSVPYEPAALAYEATTEDAGHEFARRVRIGAGNWQALARLPELLDPRIGFPFFAFVSHKLLRWLTPLLLAIALAGTFALALRPGDWAWRALLAGQLAFYGLALLGARGAAGPLRAPAALAHYFVGMNASLAAGFWRFVRGTQSAAWKRTERGLGVEGPVVGRSSAPHAPA
jgi:cellulose synthase/poly-beta-1,6-N-acetylglucosamine synthase-like glycosyltransferase